jgi:anti-anti-sigma factor
VDPWTVGSIAEERVVAGPAGSVVVVRLEGEHDLTTAAAVRAALAGVDDGDGLVVDLQECAFVDSSIIAALLQARRQRLAFALVLPSDQDGAITRALTITGVAPLLGCCGSVDEALARLAASDGADGASP